MKYVIEGIVSIVKLVIVIVAFLYVVESGLLEYFVNLF